MIGCMQVTRLTCGGFIFALRFNHTITDGCGLGQFMTALGEIARGASSPSVTPVWMRELFIARDDPPKVTSELQDVDTKSIIPFFNFDDMVQKSFFFGSSEISTLTLLPRHLCHKCTTFEVLTAYLCQCRTISLQTDPDEEVSLIYTVNVRSSLDPPLPKGFYGNIIASAKAVTTAGSLMKNPLGNAVELVMKSKSSVTKDYMKLVPDRTAIRERRRHLASRPYMVSDARRTGFREVDMGWGKPVHAGPAYGGVGTRSGSYYVPVENKEGDKGILVSIGLPRMAMERFIREMEMMMEE